MLLNKCAGHLESGLEKEMWIVGYSWIWRWQYRAELKMVKIGLWSCVLPTVTRLKQEIKSIIF